MLVQKNKVIKLKTNNEGRDFIVGDLHGCYKALTELLKTVNFNTKKDRLISVGDLIDRGPDSLKCLSLLKKSWFYCVLGNHEDMLINYLDNISFKKPYDEVWLNKISTNNIEIRKFAREYLKELKELPLVLSVGSGDEKFYVVHAELIDKHKKLKEKNIENWQFANYNYTEHHAIWGRKIYNYSNSGKVCFPHDNNLNDIYCGHSILEAPMRMGKQIFLDRGAFAPYNNIRFKLNKNSKLIVRKSVPFTPGLIIINPKEKKGYLYKTASGQVKSFVYY